MAEKSILPLVEKFALLEGFKNNSRRELRGFHSMRDISFSLSRSNGHSSAEVALGRTIVRAEAQATVVSPYPERPLEGILSVGVELTPIASPSVDSGRPSPQSIELSRLLDKQLRESRAVDTETLCIQPEKAVWEIRLDVRVLNDSGNLRDACSLAALAALMHLRRAHVEFRSGEVHVLGYDESPPDKLNMRHYPLTVSFGIVLPSTFLAAQQQASSLHYPLNYPETGGVGLGSFVFLDPDAREEQVVDGILTFCVNSHGELCGFSSAGAAVSTAEITKYLDVSLNVSREMIKKLNAAIKDADRDVQSTTLKFMEIAL